MIRMLDDKAFTLIELMLALGLFSVILIISTSGFIGINRTYTRGAIKKQLSESVQRLDDRVAVDLHNPQGTVTSCAPTDTAGCPPGKVWNALCLSGARYLWPNLVTSTDGGVYVDHKPRCDDPVDTTKEQVVDSRFVMELFTIKPLQNHLYQVTGMLHTSDLGALTTTGDNSQSLNRVGGIVNPSNLRCKGSSAGSIVQTCAVESFDFIINSRGTAS